MAKTKPKWGVSYSAKFVRIEDGVIQKIAKGIDFELSEESAEKLRTAIGFYQYHLMIFDGPNRVRRANVAAALNELLEKPAPLPALIQMLEEIDPVTRHLLTTQSPASSHFDFEHLKYELTMLKLAAEDAQKNVKPDKGSRPSDVAFRQLVKDLSQIYLDCTGNQARSNMLHDRETDEYYGSFLDFVSACLNALGKKYQSNPALGKAIYRALNTLK